MATISGWDRQHGYDDAREPDLIDYSEAVSRQEWQASVDSYEDGASEVEPVEWKEFWG